MAEGAAPDSVLVDTFGMNQIAFGVYLDVFVYFHRPCALRLLRSNHYDAGLTAGAVARRLPTPNIFPRRFDFCGHL